MGVGYIDKMTVDGKDYNFVDVGAVRHDEAQDLTWSQKAMARNNIGATGKDDLVSVDNTLTQAGEAADAAVVGAALAGKIDGAYADEEGYLVLTIGGVPTGDRIGPFAGGGGGGGGSSGNNAVIEMTKTSDWVSKTIAEDTECHVTFTWSSIENEVPTGNGNMTIQVNRTNKVNVEIAQGAVDVDVSGYLAAGSNQVALIVSDIYGNTRSIRVTITVISLRLSSTFDNSAPYTGAILFPYTPTGNVSKTVHFLLDDVEIGTATTSVNGRQQSFTIPQQRHGAHTFRCYFEAEINGQMVPSNELYYEIICLEPSNNTPVITSTYRKTRESQYNTIGIDYTVYNPAAISSDVTIKVNGEVVSTVTVDRTSHVYSYRAEEAGTVTIQISTGTQGEGDYASKSWTITIDEVEIDIEAETEGLALFMNARGRSNDEAPARREEWKSGNIAATLTGFNWRINGWMKDDDGVDVFRLCGDARATIPYQIFGTDFKQTGKTIELEFATREVADYNATIFSCVTEEENGKRVGLKITPQAVYFDGHQTSISTLYKENEHIWLSITVEKQSEYRVILIYINGIASRAIQYASGERFSQLEPVGISIGSSDCGIDIYNIRVYDQNLSSRQVLNNWIADTQIGSLMMDRYTRNNIYSANGEITVATLNGNIPYFMLTTNELPQFKGDEKTISGTYVDPIDGTKSFTFVGCVINAQGTSSSVYYVKNIDMKFKDGFSMTSSGTKASTYALRSGSIPFNRFVLKADVASSESANNTGLTMFYNDTCPYNTPEMIEDPRVRWGIEGIPILMFQNDPDTGVVKFKGKYNFNLPKRAPEPLGYSGNMESWEVERNNSQNVKFLASDFETMVWDELKQEYYPEWYDDFEARCPSDEWRNIDKLREFTDWVVSTARVQATGGDLEESVAYIVTSIATLNSYSSDDSYTVEEITEEGVRTGYRVTFTKDTPAYRLTKFYAEASSYIELQSAVFYYLFTEFFLMIDSRAKNMFIGFNGSNIGEATRKMDRKATFQPYDMDTAIGTNNSGVLMFTYSLEDTDTVSAVISGEGGSDGPVFNAQDSVLWCNLRDSFRADITTMYRALRTSGAWSYAVVEAWFEQHQSKWSEAIYNEDAREKYLVPLIDPVTVDEDTGQLVRTDRYLTMLQGSKAEQRKWWLLNRFRYMDSKYNTGDASKTIDMRLFNDGTLSIKAAIDVYIGVRFGGGSTAQLKRTEAGEIAAFTYTAQSGVTEMETWIYSADLITDVGDLSVFYPNELNFSKATRLRRLKIGSSAEGYSNSNLTTLDVRNSSLLEHIDCRNCPRLAITVNLEGSPRLKEAYFDGTAITGVELADGATVETLHLPSTITTLTLMNLDKLTDLTVGSYASVTRLMLANMDDEIIDPVTVLNAIPANSQVYIEGLYLDLDDADDIEDFLHLLDTMRGVTRERGTNGEWLYHDQEKAQVSGIIHTDALTGAQIASYQARYPYITIQADHVTSYLYYKNFDGSELLYTETILDGGDGVWNGSPSRSSTAQYNFTFVGWSTSQDAQSAGANARKGIVADRTVYAAYSRSIRSYSVRFFNVSTQIGNTQTINYGSSATPPANPTHPTDPDNYAFTSWSPSPYNITGNTDCYAQYRYTGIEETITDSWDEIFAAHDNGTVSTKYPVGGTKIIDLGSLGTITMQIAGFSKDTKADGTGKASVSWIGEYLLPESKRFNPELETIYKYPEIPSWTASGNTWTSQNRYNISTAKATWTLTATSDGTITISYKTTNNTASNNKITTLTVNGTAVATDFCSTTAATHDVAVTTGDTVTVYAEYDQLKASNNYYGTIVFSSTGTFTTEANVQTAPNRVFDHYTEGTGSIGGWEKSELRQYFIDTVYPAIPANIRNRIVAVTKTQPAYNTAGSSVTQTTTDKVWIPSYNEVFGSSSLYYDLFEDTSAKRIKQKPGTGSAAWWWLRSAYYVSAFNGVHASGSSYGSNANGSGGLALGFCT